MTLTAPTHDDSTDLAGQDDAPPPYQPMPNTAVEHSLQYGPSRPFQPATIQPTTYTPPNHPPPPLPPRQPPTPQVPFWNGPNLTPQQTGYSHANHGWNGPGNHYGPHQPPFESHHSHSSPPPQQQQQQQQQQQYHQFQAPQGPPPPLPHRPASVNPPAQPHYTPTQIPTPGQPLLNKGRLLVYPVGQAVCHKCDNTGYKSNDPTHPCRKCWEKSGKPYSAALRLSHQSSPIAPSNFQRPLRVFAPPQQQQQHNLNSYPGAYRRGGTQVMHSQMGPPRGDNVLVVRPGDPRIGGNMCLQCRGSGFTTSMWMFDEETCTSCRGAGRVFY